jgi:hypothetical protein
MREDLVPTAAPSTGDEFVVLQTNMPQVVVSVRSALVDDDTGRAYFGVIAADGSRWIITRWLDPDPALTWVAIPAWPHGVNDD